MLQLPVQISISVCFKVVNLDMFELEFQASSSCLGSLCALGFKVILYFPRNFICLAKFNHRVCPNLFC